MALIDAGAKVEDIVSEILAFLMIYYHDFILSPLQEAQGSIRGLS